MGTSNDFSRISNCQDPSPSTSNVSSPSSNSLPLSPMDALLVNDLEATLDTETVISQPMISQTSSPIYSLCTNFEPANGNFPNSQTNDFEMSLEEMAANSSHVSSRACSGRVDSSHSSDSNYVSSTQTDAGYGSDERPMIDLDSIFSADEQTKL